MTAAMLLRRPRAVAAAPGLPAATAPDVVGGQVSQDRPGGAGPLVTWSLEAPTAVRRGQTFVVTLRAKVTPGRKFYAAEQTGSGPRPLRVQVADTAFALEGKLAPDAAPVQVKDTIWHEVVA